MKERIIGAAVLVALVVLVVPVFLDGPPVDGKVHSERVPLPGQDEQKSQTVVLERNRSEPVPAQSAAETPGAAAVQTAAPPATPASATRAAEVPRREPDAQPAREAVQASAAGPAAPGAEPERPADEQPAASTPVRTAPPPSVAPAVSATGMFAVQLGSFSRKENAESLAAELRRQGFAAFLSQLDTGTAPLHRVRVGPQKDRQAAESMAARLARAGHEGQVVPHP